jgi:outer membrane protein OmpA-like peptidoglycan-associated protein
MKHLTFFFIILTTFNAAAQKVKIKTFYKDGRTESEGVLFTYEKWDKRVPKKYEYFKGISQKEGEWKYWYPNGQLKRIENYIVIADPKHPRDTRHGKWIYYNDQGVKYREEQYTLNSLTGFVKEIYDSNNRYFGKITLENGILDTILERPLIKENNLIRNPDFDFFFYKPVPVTYEGQSRIEDWIPYWVTPDNNTPDYISNLRIINLMSYGFLVDFPLPDKFNFIGIALYKKSDLYSENIQGQLDKPLIKGQKYCLKTTITLSLYSGFTINRIGFYFSDYMIYGNLNSVTPQIVFTDLPSESKSFITLCDSLIANGDEEFITIARFAPVEQTQVVKRSNMPISSFGLENSAYYLIDKIELSPINAINECDCKVKIPEISSEERDTINEESEIGNLGRGKPVVLRNVNFEFNSFTLQARSELILKELLDYLNKNPELSIEISGHTDDVGSDDYNLNLSLNRAKSVYQWLINNGIAEERLTYNGYGKNKPLYLTTDEKLKALNRRVEVRIQQ